MVFLNILWHHFHKAISFYTRSNHLKLKYTYATAHLVIKCIQKDFVQKLLSRKKAKDPNTKICLGVYTDLVCFVTKIDIFNS
jgi:ssDNA-binding Zn-finger/Zn-ribbon topoisomerase 1